MANQEFEAWEKEIRAPRQSVVFFTRQLATMLDSGVNLIDALECLGLQGDSPDFSLVIQTMVKDLDRGASLSQASARFPKVFPSLYVNMARVAESTGQYSAALARTADWLERDQAIVQRVKGALTYPLLVLVVSMLLTLSVFTLVLPRFMNIFLSLGAELPFLTRIVMLITKIATNPGSWVLLGVLLPVMFYTAREAWSDPASRLRLFTVMLKFPILGPILQFATLARFCAAARLSLATGLDLLGSVSLSAQASGSPLIEQNAIEFRQNLAGGLSLSEHMRQHEEIYGRFLTNLVAAGEEAASVEAMFARAEPYFDEEVKHLVDMLGSALEPILLLGTGLMVGLILLSIFMPMYSYLNVL